jgi:hypothetical protein
MSYSGKNNIFIFLLFLALASVGQVQMDYKKIDKASYCDRDSALSPAIIGSKAKSGMKEVFIPHSTSQQNMNGLRRM